MSVDYERGDSYTNNSEVNFYRNYFSAHLDWGMILSKILLFSVLFVISFFSWKKKNQVSTIRIDLWELTGTFKPHSKHMALNH